MGSLAVDGADRFSDLDLTFGIAAPVPVAHVLDDWTRTFVDELDAIYLADLERGPTIYRVFLLPDALQFDLSMTPAARFRPPAHASASSSGRRPRARRRRHPSPEMCSSRRRPSRGPSSGGASSTRSTRARASSEAVAGGLSTTSVPCGIARCRSPASSEDSPRRKRAATTIARGEPRSIRVGPCRHGRPRGSPVGPRRVHRRAPAGGRRRASARSSRRGATRRAPWVGDRPLRGSVAGLRPKEERCSSW